MMNEKEYKKFKIKQYYKNEYRKKKVINNYIKNYIKNKKEDIIFKIRNNLARRAYGYKNKLDETHIQLIGCTSEQLKLHIEKQFTEGMTYDNYGKWEIDHIKAITNYDLTDTEQIKECFNFKNLQPLWKIDNIIKSNKVS